jgi:CRISPR-associated endoribonuclease Cas6
MLLSLILQLTATADATLATEPGRATQGLFLHWLERRDAALSASLHNVSAARPYTTSGLLLAGRHTRCSEVHAGQRYWLRFTTLHADLSGLLLDAVQELSDHQIELGGVPFAIESVASEAAAHPWAGRTSYDALVQTHFLNLANPSRRVALDFASPTAFHRTGPLTPNSSSQGNGEREATVLAPEQDRRKATGDVDSPLPPHGRGAGDDGRQLTIPLPLPELVLGSLLARWNVFAPLTLPDDVRRYAQECLAVSRYRLQSHAVQFGQAISVGFTGQCQYTALVWDPYWLRVVSLLAAYAFYSGVGLRTTVGMGQVRSI